MCGDNALAKYCVQNNHIYKEMFINLNMKKKKSLAYLSLPARGRGIKSHKQLLGEINVGSPVWPIELESLTL